MASSAHELFADTDEVDLRISSLPYSRHEDARRYRLGLDRIDAQMRLFQAGEFALIGAREGQGKTSLLEHIALANATDYRILNATLEMPTDAIRDRCMAKLMGMSLDDVQYGHTHQSEDFLRAEKRLEERDLMVWQPPRGKTRSIEAITRRAEDVSADMLMIDYTRMLHGWQPGKEAAAIVNYLADWTKSTFITTILLTQLRDEAVSRRPHNGHIQDTTQLPQRADRVILLWRPYLGNPRKDHVSEIIVTKNRAGPCFRAHAHWVGATMDYFDMLEDEEANVTCCRRH